MYTCTSKWPNYNLPRVNMLTICCMGKCLKSYYYDHSGLGADWTPTWFWENILEASYIRQYKNIIIQDNWRWGSNIQHKMLWWDRCWSVYRYYYGRLLNCQSLFLPALWLVLKIKLKENFHCINVLFQIISFV